MWNLLALLLLFRCAPMLTLGLMLGGLVSLLILVGASAPGHALAVLTLAGFGLLVLRSLFALPYQ